MSEREIGKHAGDPGAEDDAGRLVSWLLRLSMLSGAAAFVAALFGSVTGIMIGVGLLIGGSGVAGYLVFRRARTQGIRYMPALKDAMRESLRWLRDFL